MIGIPDVLSHRHWIVALQRRGGDLVGGRSRNVLPEALRRFYVGLLVDVDPEAQAGARGSGYLQESQEEADQRGIAVDENNPVAAGIGLALPALAPVSDCPGDQHLAVGQRTNLASGGIAGSGACRRAHRAFSLPVAAGALGRPLPAFLIAETDRAGEVAHPERHRALGYAECLGDLLVVQALLAQLAGALPHVILSVGTAGPFGRRLALEGFVEGGVAHWAQDLFDLAAGLALATELDNAFLQDRHFLSISHTRTLI